MAATLVGFMRLLLAAGWVKKIIGNFIVLCSIFSHSFSFIYFFNKIIAHLYGGWLNLSILH